MAKIQIESKDVRSLVTNFMVTILKDDPAQWYEDGSGVHRCTIHGTNYMLDTRNGITNLTTDDWFVQAMGGTLHLWGDVDKFYRDVTLLRLFGIPSEFG